MQSRPRHDLDPLFPFLLIRCITRDLVRDEVNINHIPSDKFAEGDKSVSIVIPSSEEVKICVSTCVYVPVLMND